MANNTNIVVFSGNLVRNINIRKVTYGTGDNKIETKVADFTIASNRKDKVTYLDCTAWDSQAEYMEKYLNTKGSGLQVVGHLINDNYTDANGVKQFRMRLAVESIENHSRMADESPWA